MDNLIEIKKPILNFIAGTLTIYKKHNFQCAFSVFVNFGLLSQYYSWTYGFIISARVLEIFDQRNIKTIS